MMRIVMAAGLAAAVGMLIIFGPLLALPLAAGLGAGMGGLVTRVLNCAPEHRTRHLVQLALVVVGAGLSIYVSSLAGFQMITCTLVAVGFLLMLLVPNLSQLAGTTFFSLIDRPDWTPEDEEIALRPIRLLIDRDNYRQALGELDELLQKRKPTYEAILIRAKLLHHIGRIDEAEADLHRLIRLSHSTPQQEAVMDMLLFIEKNRIPPLETPLAARGGPGRIEINHELILLQISGEDPAARKVIPPGCYEIERVLQRQQQWLKLKSENWGNWAACWRAVEGPVAAATAAETAPQPGFLGIKFKPERRKLALDAKELFKQAGPFIRSGDWPQARPLLERAARAEPDKYEYAYRWLESVRHTSDHVATAKTLSLILEQSQWSASEETMLRQMASRQ